jgi:rhodanese-related sulfurtransferase
MEADAVAKGLESGELQAIDVRDDSEWDAGRAPGSRHVLLSELPANADSIDKGTPVVFVCRGGSRSAMAAEAFRASGYEAFNLRGGLVAWAEAGLPLEPDDGEVAERSLT